MAVAKIGSLFANLAGSINDTTIRRDGNKLVVGSKAKPVNRQRLRDNPALSRLRNYFNVWTFLTPQEKSDWETAGQRLQYRDRFGDLVNYTGRQLFVSINSGLEGTGEPLPNPANISSTVAQPNISGVTATTQGDLEVTLQNTHFNAYAIFQVEIKVQGATAPNAKRYKKIAVLDANQSTNYNLTNFFRDAFSIPIQGRAIRVYCTLVNNTGFRSIQVSKFTMLS